MPSLLDLSRSELAAWCQSEGAQPFRSDQIRKWLFGKRVNDFDAMTDVPAALRKRLTESFDLFSSRIVAHQKSQDGTEKLLLELGDGERIECVLMREDDRRTICLSTQGRHEEANKQLTERVKVAASADHDIAYWLGTAYLLQGRQVKALEWLQTAIELGNENYLWFESDPNWTDLHDDPRFKDLVHRIGLPE